VYPNSGEVWNPDSREWSGAASAIASNAGEWVNAGARLIGGCCRVGPDQIARIARAVASTAARAASRDA
jgi:homocysteine S-methyltransferase